MPRGFISPHHEIYVAAQHIALSHRQQQQTKQVPPPLTAILLKSTSRRVRLECSLEAEISNRKKYKAGKLNELVLTWPAVTHSCKWVTVCLTENHQDSLSHSPPRA